MPKKFAAMPAVGLALVAAAFLMSACSGAESTGETTTNAGPVQPGGELKVATAFEPITLDPNAGQTDPGSQHAQVLIFDRLVTLEPGSAEIKPSLAESWEFSDGRRSLTFHLRDVKFSDGSAVTSEDVRFSLERAMDSKTDPNFAESLQTLIASVSTPDPKTVVLNFDGPAPAILPFMAFAPTSIVSKEAYERIGADRFAVAPVGAGTGPFMLGKWIKGQRVELERNPHYWREGLPYLDEVELQLVPDDNARLLALRSGQVEIADDVPYSQLETIEQTPGVKLQVTPVAAVFGPFLSGRGPLKDIAVRQALTYATPRETIRDVALAGQGELANSFIPPMQYPAEDLEPIPFDVEKAKQLMAESDQPGGFDLELLIQSGDAVSKQAAAILQDAWQEIGVNLEIQPIESGALINRTFSGDFTAAMFPPTVTSSDTPSEDQFAIQLTTPAWEEIMGHADPELDSLIKKIEGTWDEDERRELFAEYLRQMQEDPVFDPIAVASARTALQDNVEGFDYILSNWLYLDRTWLAD